MAQAQPTVAGRTVPVWIGRGVWLLLLVLLGALLLRLSQLDASATLPPDDVDLEALVAARPAPPAPPAVPPRAPLNRLALDRPLQHGDYVWNDRGVPPGRLWIHIDIANQTLYVFRGDYEIGRAVILYGTDENPTPFGTFPILEKDIDHESNIYDAAMPYMLRLTNDGIAIHGSEVIYGRASRGCIGVPDPFAALLFAQARIGDRVTVAASGPPPFAPRA